MPLLEATLLSVHGCNNNHSVLEAVRRRHIQALEFLLCHGAKNFDEQCYGRRALHHALQCCLATGDVGYKMAELLLKAGARPVQCPGDDPEAGGPLHDAARRGIAAGVELLLRWGADPRVGDAHGSTPLHIACQSAMVDDPLLRLPMTPFQPEVANLRLEIDVHIKVVNLLLRNGACPFQKDRVGLLPEQYTSSVRVRGTLSRARQWWERRALIIVRGRSETQGDDPSSKPSWFLPGIFENILVYF